jgi:hypothetical protein
MGLGHSPSIVTNGLVFCYDFGNREKSFGTTNLLPNASLGIYNNVPGDVTASLTQTSETYRGSPVWALSLTPTTSSGVSYLTAGNNPGLGVVTGGGGGTGGVYTGHSIFFRTTVPMHTNPIYTHYSNIGGWQTYTNYDNMNDGWNRAHVIWYDTVTRSDGKYWAINPASATLNVPIITYWAAPFKESQNYTFVSPYTLNTRGTGNGIINLVNSSFSGGTLVNGSSYDSSNGGHMIFDGANDHINIGVGKGINQFSADFAINVWVMRLNGGPTWGNIIGDYYTGSVATTNEWQIMISNTGAITFYRVGSGSIFPGIPSGFSMNQWINITISRIGSNLTMYSNGNLIASTTNSDVFGTPTGNLNLGIDGNNVSEPLYGRISNVMIYKNKGLTSAEVSQNFNALRGRFGV